MLDFHKVTGYVLNAVLVLAVVVVMLDLAFWRVV